MANWFSLFPKEILKHPKVSKNAKLKKQLTSLFKKLDNDQIIADRDWNGKEPWMIKVNKDNQTTIKETKGWTEGKSLEGGKQWRVDADGIEISWRKSSKVEVSKASTREQELGSAYIFKRALTENAGWDKWEDILKEKKTYKELQKIWGGDVDTEWLQSYFAQSEVMLKEFKTKFKIYNRDDGFMDFISKAVKKVGYSQKDTWNPADIWAIKTNSSAIEKEIKNSQTVYEINNILRHAWNKKEIIGISLKKTKKKAHWEEVNIDDLLFDTSDKDYNFPCDASNFSCGFGIKSGKDNFTQDVRLTISGAGGSSQEFSFQIKANSPEAKGGSNLKFEASMKGKGSARLGKAPVDQLAGLLADFKPSEKFTNKYSAYPGTLKEFNKSGVASKWATKIKKLIAAGMVAGKGEKNLPIKTIMENIRKSYQSKNDRGTNTRCKLMGIQFFCSLLSLSKPKLREFVTDMVYICQKKATTKSDHYGPFGKIY
jgi:signal recognition particle subunit SEC65